MSSLSSEDLRAIRQKYNIAQAEWAAITGFSLTSVNRWENGVEHGRSVDRYYRLLSDPVVFEKARALLQEERSAAAAIDQSENGESWL